MPHTIQGEQVGEIGFGLLGLTWNSTPVSEEQAFAAMRAALESGCNYWNAGEFYGPPDHNSLTLLNKYYALHPGDAARVLLNVKACTGENFRPDGSPEGVRRSAENCLRMLGPGPGAIDQFEPARRDPEVPVEVTVKAIADLAAEGKVGGVALSEVSAATIRRAAKVAKIEAVEVELSLWNTEPLTNGVCEACAELGIPILAYAPLGRGALTGKIRSIDDIPEGDFRRMLPRFQPENFATNLRIVDEVARLAEKKGCTPAQVAINWVVSLGRRPGMPVIIPIPGASSPERVRENARLVELSGEDVAEIERLLASFPVVGERYHHHGMELLDK
ncbi:Aldo/keto reductase [Pleurostoma richardsiae]|uniref:Aldo/keto reductase n=1 Tax=Pleurostoma richardsiae TaxID=41990 RepID=A0AA38RLN6_9PEZI|nr:Aldo/keto reductase [Pleurostoma richardsiae]